MLVGLKQTPDPDVIEMPNDDYRNPLARSLLAAGNPWWPLRGRVKLIRRIHSVLRWIGEPQSWLDRERGIEDFRCPATWHMLDLLPDYPDIIHCHNLHAGYFDLRALPWLSHQVPTILNLRDSWTLTGHCAYFFDCERWKSGCGQCPYPETYPAIKRDASHFNWHRKRAIYDRSHLYITTPSQWMMDRVQESMLNGNLHRVIPNAIDLTIFRPESKAKARTELDLPVQAKIVLLTAHTRFKDYATMEAALSQITPPDSVDGANSDLIFLCLGKSEPAKVVGQGHMHYQGFVRDQRQVAKYYQAADVFIHASRDEAFGKAIVEAQACGTPVIATAVGGATELVQEGVTGFRVAGGDSVGMATALQRLLCDPRRCAAMGEAGATFAAIHFGLPRQVDTFLDWYAEIREHFQCTIANRKVNHL